MKDNLLEKLMQLFDERLSKPTANKAPHLDRDTASFPENWGALSNIEDNSYYIKPTNKKSKRIFSPEERLKFTKKTYQFLEKLIQLDLIGERTFEMIVNQLLFSDSDYVKLHEAKWIIHHTLESSLTPQQLAFLNLILFDKEDCLVAH